MKFVLASNNGNKLREIRQILSPLGIEILSQKEAGISVNPEENGETFKDNSLIKARAACAASGLPTLADDSGLVVEALNGAPGVYSARYGGDNCSDRGRCELLLHNMEGRENRKAAFVSCISCVFPDGTELTAEGRCEGEILHEICGKGGFGYDPVFFSNDLQESLGVAPQEEKNIISHRGRALRAMAKILEERLNGKDSNND